MQLAHCSSLTAISSSPSAGTTIFGRARPAARQCKRRMRSSRSKAESLLSTATTRTLPTGPYRYRACAFGMCSLCPKLHDLAVCAVTLRHSAVHTSAALCNPVLSHSCFRRWLVRLQRRCYWKLAGTTNIVLMHYRSPAPGSREPSSPPTAATPLTMHGRMPSSSGYMPRAGSARLSPGAEDSHSAPPPPLVPHSGLHAGGIGSLDVKVDALPGLLDVSALSQLPPIGAQPTGPWDFANSAAAGPWFPGGPQLVRAASRLRCAYSLSVSVCEHGCSLVPWGPYLILFSYALS